MRGSVFIAKFWITPSRKQTIWQSTVHHAVRRCSSKIPEKYGFSKKDVKEFNFVTHILKPWADKLPNHCALWLSDGSKSMKLSYKELLQTSQYLATALHYNGSPKCALAILPKISPWWTVNVAGSFIGMVISPGTAMLTEKEVLYRLEKCNADVLFCSSDLMHRYDTVTRHMPYRILCEESKEDEQSILRNGWLSYHDLIQKGRNLPKVGPIKNGDAIAQLFFTSGTTGNPKMVPHTQVGYGIGHQEGSRSVFGLTSSDVFWNLSDLGWAKAAYSSLYLPAVAGCTIFIHQMARFDSTLVIKTLIENPITVFCCPPTALRTIVQNDISSIRHSSLKRVFSAGEPLNPEAIEIWNFHTGVPIHDVYGQSETSVVIGNKAGDVQKLGSMGRQTDTYDVVIVDDDCNELADDETGQIAISLKKSFPYGLCKEYFNNEIQTRKSFANGYFLTGDKAFRDRDGYFWYVGRDDDIITSAGYRIGPFEVESALLEHPAVAESAVVASPDPTRGHVLKAFIVLTDQHANQLVNDEYTADLKKDIQEFTKLAIAPYKYPRKIEFVRNLPKTVSGKIRRIELREKESRAYKLDRNRNQ